MMCLATLISDAPAVGFATEGFSASANTGVGDDDFSWAYDGDRELKWHNGATSFC
eukprot:SAG31_NODE_29919_length_388_cov_0.719723_1_plen_55_part_01